MNTIMNEWMTMKVMNDYEWMTMKSGEPEKRVARKPGKKIASSKQQAEAWNKQPYYLFGKWNFFKLSGFIDNKDRIYTSKGKKGLLVALEVGPSNRPSFKSNEDIKVFYCRKFKIYLVPYFIYSPSFHSSFLSNRERIGLIHSTLCPSWGSTACSFPPLRSRSSS